MNKRIELLAVAHPQYLLLVTLADDEVVHAQGPSRGLRQRQLLSTCVSSDSFSEHLLPHHIAHSERNVVSTQRLELYGCRVFVRIGVNTSAECVGNGRGFQIVHWREALGTGWKSSSKTAWASSR